MLKDKIFHISSQAEFDTLALQVFTYQFEQVEVYRNFCEFLKIDPDAVKSVEDIPFLPIEFFKLKQVLAQDKRAEMVFQSSGTTGSTRSKHFVSDLQLYEQCFLLGFKRIYGDPSNYTILALLPSYMEQGHSSLVYMVDRLIKASSNPKSGFFLHNTEDLIRNLVEAEAAGSKTLLIGVSYALLDMVEDANFQLEHTLVMETGGMKGRREEMIREALHERLKERFGLEVIHSEYGMTELLSQAYSKGNGIFQCPPWMNIYTRDPEDPFTLVTGKTGGLNIIDLANVNSCSFIATQDLGKIHAPHSFEILGRFDHSDIRGCNLMVL
ncbi:MAG: acyl transferase [Bacteroidia bacterium]|nr:acyl transferase [Bacteroidia bacterium]